MRFSRPGGSSFSGCMRQNTEKPILILRGQSKRDILLSWKFGETGKPPPFFHAIQECRQGVSRFFLFACGTTSGWWGLGEHKKYFSGKE
jgi:hypothetical protein